MFVVRRPARGFLGVLIILSMLVVGPAISANSINFVL